MGRSKPTWVGPLSGPEGLVKCAQPPRHLRKCGWCGGLFTEGFDYIWCGHCDRSDEDGNVRVPEFPIARFTVKQVTVTVLDIDEIGS